MRKELVLIESRIRLNYFLPILLCRQKTSRHMEPVPLTDSCEYVDKTEKRILTIEAGPDLESQRFRNLAL